MIPYFVAAAIFGLFFLIDEKSEAGTNMSNNFDDIFKKYGLKYGIDWKMLKAIAIIESSLGRHASVRRGIENPKDIQGSKSDDGLSWGLMQVRVETAQDYDSSASAEKLNNPDYAVKIASQHLKRLQSVFSNDTEKVIKSYNQGEGNTKKNKPYADQYWVKYQNAYKSIN